MARSGRHTTGRTGTIRRSTGDGREWVGGRITPPFFIEDRGEPVRVEIALWMELPSGLVVGQEVASPERVSGAVGRALGESLQKPLAGSPRRPARLRVSDRELAREVRAVVGETIPVIVAPTPELDSFLAHMLESAPRSGQQVGESYLERGRVPVDAVERLFEAARLLYTVKPWTTADDDQVLRMDIPSLGVGGACVSIIGALGESLGFVIFSSFGAYKDFIDAADRRIPRAGSRDPDARWLSLGFERGADLPATMRKEVSCHGWPVADANAYPLLVRRDADGTPWPLTARDFAIATACAASLSAFFVKHASHFETLDTRPVCESWLDDDDLEVRFTYPYEAFELFDVAHSDEIRATAEGARASDARASNSAPRTAATGRNAQCPCGSGLKYKRCCLPRVDEERATRNVAEREHELDWRVARLLWSFADQRSSDPWREFMEEFAESETVLPFVVSWGIYHLRVAGATVCDHFLRERGFSLMPAERDWLEVQRAAWLSVWEVTAVSPGESMTLVDLLSGERRVVREKTASQSLVVRDVVLARVVDGESGSLVCGLYPRALLPTAGAEVIRRARGRLRLRRAVSVDRLRDDAFGRYLIRIWKEAVEEADAERAAALARPPRLQNTDGDAFLLTTDRFVIEAGEAAAVETCLAALPGVQPSGNDPEDPQHAFVFIRSGSRGDAREEGTILGSVLVAGDELRIETNSRARADALRAQVEAACGARIRHRTRDHADPLSARAERRVPEPATPVSPEIQQIVMDFKRRHYAGWIDEPLPALSGRTPRDAIRTASGRTAVDLLLREMENREHRTSGGAAFDFSEIRRALRLDRPEI